MAEASTIARPYAKAAFAVAQAAGKTAEWGRMLERAARVVRDPAFAVLIGNPKVDSDRLAALLSELAGEKSGAALFGLLAERRRLTAVPEIQTQFEALCADAENRIDVEVVSAVAVDDTRTRAIAAALKKRLGREVTVKVTTDPALLGGAVIRAGDLVIDGSVKGRLEKLAACL